MEQDWLVFDKNEKRSGGKVELTKEELTELVETIFAFKPKEPSEGNPFWIFIGVHDKLKRELTAKEVLHYLEKGKLMFVQEFCWNEDKKSTLVSTGEEIYVKAPKHLVRFFEKRVKPHFLVPAEKQ